MDYSLPSSSVHGTSQVRILKWVGIFSSKGSSWPRDGSLDSCVADSSPLSQQRSPVLAVLSHFSRVGLFAAPWTVSCQAPLSMGFSRQDYRSGLSFLSPGYLPDPGIKPVSPALAGGFWVVSLPLSQKAYIYIYIIFLCPERELLIGSKDYGGLANPESTV